MIVPLRSEAGSGEPAKLLPGTELLGRYQGSGAVEERYLIRRADRRIVEVSSLLYLLASSVDGARDSERIAADLSEQLGKNINPADVHYLIVRKLQPLGVVENSAGSQQCPSTPAPLLGLAVRRGVVPTAVVRRVAKLLRPLFRPPVVLLALVGLVALDAWLVRGPGAWSGLGDLSSGPALFLFAVALTVLAGGIHEFGHATASCYGGAEPGVIGVGLYLIWPVFYNDLNDSYRLGRSARVRADLGGVYFNVLFILVQAGAFAATGFRPLLGAVIVQHLMILQQFLPFVRLDGYYLVSDLVGVPDLFGHIKPVLSSFLPGAPTAPALTALRPRARTVVTMWVLGTLPVLGACVLLVVVRLPDVLGRGWSAAGVQAPALARAVRAGAPIAATVEAVQLLFLTLPFAGLGLLVLRAGRRRRDARADHGSVPGTGGATSD